MSNASIEFYDAWARQQMDDPLRGTVLKWKAVTLATLFLRSTLVDRVECICEVGGAEGILLNVLGSLLETGKTVNYELSTEFCHLGSTLYPQIRFINAVFDEAGEPFDVIVLSDILEHVEDDAGLLEAASKRCRYALIKIPIEKCLSASNLRYLLTGKTKPREQCYGPQHVHGHLRGYTVREALALISPHFEPIDRQLSDVIYFYPSTLKKRWLGVSLTFKLFGGALFVLGKSRRNS
jgi:hypothetical protein